MVAPPFGIVLLGVSEDVPLMVVYVSVIVYLVAVEVEVVHSAIVH